MIVDRKSYIDKINETFDLFPVCAILGPRQVGKTTLAHSYIQQLERNIKTYFYDLEDPIHLDQLKNPKTALDPLTGLIIIDEIQRLPELFPYLRVLSDYSDKKFLILGSASGTLLNQSSESLAGRIDYIELTPLSLSEVDSFEDLWLRGGFPKSLLAKNSQQSLRWRKSYINSFIERDLPYLGISLNTSAMRQLWMMIAHCNSQLLNYSDLGRSLGITDMTVRRYTQILEQTFMIRLLKPWHENISKRQVKAPKIYIRDSGLLHALLGIDEHNWYVQPKQGALFESFALEEIIRKFGNDCEYYFWRTQVGSELDLLVIKNGKKYGFEIKYTDVPTITKSMHIATADLRLEHLYIITPSNQTYPKSSQITVLGMQTLPKFNLP